MSAVREIGLLYARNIRQLPRIPTVLVFGIVMPIIQLLLFGSLFEGISQQPGFKAQFPGVNYQAYIAPAIILFTIFVGMANSSAALIVDLRTGYFDKLRTTPARPMRVVVARLLAESTRVAGQGTLILLLALALGAKVQSGILGGIVMILLATFFSACTAGLAVMALALKTKSDQATQSTFPLFFVLLFLSTAFNPKQGMAKWLQNVVDYNPVNYLVESLRQLMIGVNEGGRMVTEWPLEKIAIVCGASVVVAALLSIVNYRLFKSVTE